MAFDFLSFAAGLVAGLIAGVLGARLQQAETISALEDKVSFALHELEKTKANRRNATSKYEQPESLELEKLRRELEELNEAIRNMYRRHTR